MKKYALSKILLFVVVAALPLLSYAQSSDKVERLENLLELSTNDTSKVRILNQLYQELTAQKPLKAKGYAEQALNLAKKNNYTPGIIESTSNIAEVYHEQGAYDKAIEFYLQVLGLQENIKDFVGIAETYNSLGNVYVLQENTEKGVDYYLKALNLYDSSQNIEGLATVYTNLGGAAYRESEYQTALDYHLQALSYADSVRNRSIIAYNLNRIGETYFRLKQYDESIKAYRQQLHLAQSESNKLDLQKAYKGLSQVYVALGDYKKAYEYYQFYTNAKEALFKDLTTDLEKEKDRIDREKQSILEQQAYIQAESQRKTLYNYLLLAIIAFIVIITVILYRNNRQKQKVNQLLEAQKQEIQAKSDELEKEKLRSEDQNNTLEATFKEIERKNKDITASINYAKRIQESMLPRSNKISQALPEHFILFRPRDIVSGDFYWFSEKNGKIILAAIDCTGHGVPGAIMSMLGDSYLNQIINLQGITEADTILYRLHESIGVALNQGETGNQDGMDVALCVFDPKTKMLEFAGAGRPLLVIKDNKYEEITSSKLPTGGFQKDRERVFTKHQFEIDRPTWFYFFSDGFQDQFGGPKGRKFAKSRLFKTIFGIHQLPMKEQKIKLNKTLVDWMGDNRQMDDIIVVGLHLSP